MRRMNDKYPDDLEVKAFYALALLGSSQGRDVGTYMKAAALVEDVVRVNPQHPGAIHYLIHAYDDPAHAPLGLRYAEAYAKIAPAASHALHMPSHIYFALGMWDKAAELNERSAKAADERVSRKGLGVDDRGFHALLWLTYSYLQQGRYQDARGVLDQIDKAAAESGSVRTRSHLALARAAWVIETRRWTDAKPDGVNPEGLGADATAADLFAIGMAAFRSGNRAAGSDALQRMATLAGDGDWPVRSVTTAKPSTTRPNPSRPGVTPMPVPRPSLPTPAELIAAQTAAAGQPQTGLPAAGSGNDKRVAAIMAQQLEAILIFSEGRRDEGLVLARQAAAVEDDLSFEFGPPLPVKPGHELVGDLSMDVRRPGDAVVAYEAALKRYPGRALSLLGLYRAAMASRQPQKAQQAAAELRKILGARRQDAARAARDCGRAAAELSLGSRLWAQGLRRCTRRVLGSWGLGTVANTMSRGLVVLLAAALVLLASSREAPQQTIEGTVLALDGRASLTVVNEQTDPTGMVFILRDTRYERLEALRDGVRVKVWCRAIGERRPVASRVHVLAE